MLPDSVCLVCGEPIIQPNYWQRPDASSCGNFCSMNYHHECYKKMREIIDDPDIPVELKRQFQRRAVNSALEMLNEEQGRAVKAIAGSPKWGVDILDKKVNGS